LEEGRKLLRFGVQIHTLSIKNCQQIRGFSPGNQTLDAHSHEGLSTRPKAVLEGVKIAGESPSRQMPVFTGEKPKISR
jgi:hypothetical protein